MIEAVINLGIKTIKSMINVYNYLSKEISILGNDFTLLELIFGAGITIVITYSIIKWTINL